jgi:hypothetical protein
MSVPAKCPICGAELQPQWVGCPACGWRLTDGLGKPVRHRAPNISPAERDGECNLSGAGLGLIGLGILGFVALFFGLLHGGLNNPDALIFIGGALVVVIMVGTALSTRKAGRATQVTTTVATGCLSVVAALGVGAMVVLFSVIYALTTCFGMLGK